MKFKFLVVLAIFAFFLISCGSDDSSKNRLQNLVVSQNTTSEEDNHSDRDNTDCNYGSYKCKGDNSYICDNGWIFDTSCDNGCDSVTGQCNPDNDNNNKNDDNDNDETDEFAELIRQNRVAVKLTYKQGFKTRAEAEVKEGAMVDLDLHLIKYHSIEAELYDFAIKEGLLGTSQRSKDNPTQPTEPENEKYWRHDDCSFGDQGYNYEGEESIQWNAKLLLDNTWGGGNYKNPEIIGLGTSGLDNIFDDQYLVVVGYVNCASRPQGDPDRCDSSYTGDDAAYEVDARVEILVDGEEAPRSGTSDIYAAGTKDFKIKANEWKAVAVIKWDSGNAIVTDSAMIDEGITTDPKNHPVCTYDLSDAVLIPIWDAEEYRNHIETQDEYGDQIGTCN